MRSGHDYDPDSGCTCWRCVKERAAEISDAEFDAMFPDWDDVEEAIKNYKEEKQ